MISIIISSNSGISMVVIIPCLCDLHGLLHVCMCFFGFVDLRCLFFGREC